LEPVSLLDKLYAQILSDAFPIRNRSTRLPILHTFLCSPEPVSASTAAKLVRDDSSETNPSFSFTKVADNVLSRLHAVIYTDAQQRVLSYHKSFSDFIFDRHRSKEYWCDSEAHHRLLTVSCFRVMSGGLRFNIANIPTSFVLDSDNHRLPRQVEQNIPPALRYCSQNWGHHLSNTTSTTSDPLANTLADFVQIHALFWIEVMNLLDARGMCDPMLRAARNWVSKLPVSITLLVL
jgi:hypothetical protein